ncbi:unnamed protein product [Rhodiola kirilowii]
MKTLFSFYKKDVDNQGPTSETQTPVPCNDSPNFLHTNEMEIPPETETGNPPITEQGMELLTLSSALDPKNQFKKFDMEKICRLAEKFYPEDFDASEVRALMLQLEHYKHQVVFDKDFQKLSSLAKLCRRLVEAELAKLFPLVDRLIRLVLTLPVSTATTERAFSAMKIIKTRLRNKMEDGYLSGCMMLHIEKEYVDDIDSETVIDHFESIGDRRAQFR